VTIGIRYRLTRLWYKIILRFFTSHQELHTLAEKASQMLYGKDWGDLDPLHRQAPCEAIRRFGSRYWVRVVEDEMVRRQLAKEMGEQ
jgi:hypothetical protein